MTLVTALDRAACYCVGMKITYDPPPARPGWLARLVEYTMAWLVQLLVAVRPK